MSENWQYNIRHVTPGEPVQAGVVGRPDRALQDRTDYLRQRLDAAALGRALFDNDATVASDVLPGQPVYWNYEAQRYEKALAAVDLVEESQSYAVRASSDCVGICLRKKAETLGDIVLYGAVAVPELQNAITGPITPGRYYLSAVEPGKLVKQRPAVTVSVCYVQGQKDSCNPIPHVVVMPNTRELVDEHTHYRFELFARPAGDNTVYTDAEEIVRHRVDNADADLPGWLPATHPSFNGRAPAGALFGYNLAQHPALSNVWPPIPIQAVSVLWDRGENYIGATDVPVGPQGLVICDLNGIWWLSDCYEDVPWPADYAGVAAPDGDDCPRPETMRVSVIFIRMLVGNDRSIVTSLIPGEDSPVVISRCNDDSVVTPSQPGTGDLALNLDLQYAVPDDVRPGYDGIGEEGLIVTGKTDNGRRLQRGFVAAGIVAHNLPQLTLTSTNTRTLTTTEKEALELPSGDAVSLHRGIIRVDFDPTGEREILPQIIRLNDTVERLFMDIPYLGFPEGQASSLRIRLNVPDINLGASLTMRVRVQMFGRGGIGQPMPALYMSYRRLLKPGGDASTAIVLTTAENDDNSEEGTLEFNTAIPVAANRAIIRESSPFEVLSGDTVLVTIGRATGDTYPEVGVLRIAGILTSA
jgi:hypothetical protein